MQRVISYIVLFLLVLGANAQDTKVVEDFQWWTGAAYTGKAFDKKLGYYGETEVRFRKNISELKSVYLEAGSYYKLLKGIKIGGALRYTHHLTWGGKTEQLFRYNIDLKLQKKIKRNTFSYRPRFQQTFADLVVDENEFANISILRNRISYRYTIKESSFSPFLSGELFTLLNYGEVSNFNIRATIGTAYSFSKKTQMKVFYRIDKEINNETPYTIHIIGTRFNFSR